MEICSNYIIVNAPRQLELQVRSIPREKGVFIETIFNEGSRSDRVRQHWWPDSRLRSGSDGATRRDSG